MTNPTEPTSNATRRIRWGIVGCGDIVKKRVARAIIDHANCQLQGAHQRDQKGLAEFCASFRVLKGYSTFEKMLQNPDIDALYIATPVASHAAQTVAGLEYGKHVLVEKPMAMTVAECDSMIDAAEVHGRRLGVAYYRRFYPHVERIRQAIDSNQLGKLLTIYAQTGNGFPYTEAEERGWRLDPALGGGGPLMDIGSHRLDLMNALAGTPQSVTALCSNPGTEYGVESCASVVVAYPHGVQGVLQCYFSAEHIPDELIVTGSRGRVVAKPLNSGQLVWEIDGQTHEENLPVNPNLHAPLIEDFVRSLLEETPPRITGQDGRVVNAMIQTAYDASRLMRQSRADFIS
ncbi:MAG: Gfo/Idh/MocA family oxidoreductase [Planctomycetota bacterium]|nr:Gfo/Idh/MocA family oxidoreductase [Planctomycetota bacterium]